MITTAAHAAASPTDATTATTNTTADAPCNAWSCKNRPVLLTGQMPYKATKPAFILFTSACPILMR